MGIISKPTIQKGQANELVLSKSELALQAKVLADNYFSDQSNWKQVVISYESDEGKQYKQIVFDASQETPAADLILSEKARDNFIVKNITITDFDGGYLKLYRGDLTTSEFDFIVGEISNGGGFVTWEYVPSAWTDIGNGGLDANGFSGDSAYITVNDQDFDYEFEFLNTEANTGDYAIGTAINNGLQVFNGLNSGSVWVNGEGIKNLNILLGLNTLRLKRVDSTFEIYLNGALESSATVDKSLQIVLYARLQGKRLETAKVTGSIISDFVTWNIAGALGFGEFEILDEGSVRNTSGNGYISVIPTLEFIPANSDGYIEMTYVDINESQYIIWGLSPAISSNYNSITFNLFRALPTYIESTYRLGNNSIFVNNGDRFRIAREGSNIVVYKNYVDENSTPFNTIPDSTKGAALYGAAAIYKTNGVIRKVKIG